MTFASTLSLNSTSNMTFDLDYASKSSLPRMLGCGLDLDLILDLHNHSVFELDFNYELDLDFDVGHDFDIDFNLVHDYDLQPDVDLD